MTPRSGGQGDAGIDTDSLQRLRASIEGTARVDPDRLALVDATESRSYAELAELLASGPGASPARRAVRVSPCVADAEAVLAAAARGESLLLLDAATTDWELERAEAIFAAAAADGPALGLCTSGSSGLPKVVELDWESLLLNAGSFAAAAGYGDADLLWCTTPLAHLFAFGAGVLAGLLVGAGVLLGKGMLELEEFAEVALSRQPTILLSVPFLFRRYLGFLEGDPQLAAAWRRRAAIAAGEPVPAELVEVWRAATEAPLRSHYGLTEGGQITLAGGDADEGVGRPIKGVEIRICEEGGIAMRRPAPGRPYRILDGEEADPRGWYETGDLGRIDGRGNLHVTGRADSRANIAGKKVDPTEVEEALRECPGVEDCATAAMEREDGSELVAFLCAGEGAPGDGELRARLAKRLSPHKLPRRFVRVAEIPRTLTGKIRRGELIGDLAQGGGDAEREGGARVEDDDSLLELVRAEAAAVVLGHATAAEIDPERSFKELGFDSLAAVALAERLGAAAGIELHPTAVFDFPTPRSLAARLRALADGAAPSTGGAPRASRYADEPIAIVGMACRFPGGVSSASRVPP